MVPARLVLLGGVTIILAALGLVVRAAPVPVPRYPMIESKSHKDFTQKIAGSKVTFDMVAIPGGSFVIGSPAREKGRRADEGPQRIVTVKPFWIGKCEVTWDEYDCFTAKGFGRREDVEPEDNTNADAVTRPTSPYIDHTFEFGRQGYPVISLTHHHLMQYCRWLALKTGKPYRLATEAEWEWAARAGTTTAYSFGDDPKHLGEYAWFADNSKEVPHPVGKKKPNPWGLYDMHGNVGEFCLDHYYTDSYAHLALGRRNLQPVNRPTDKRFSHVVRGGSWLEDASRARSAARFGSTKEWLKLDAQLPKSIWWLTSAEHVGFRVVCPVEEQEEFKHLRSTVHWESR
jgi:formylglycine-generating enzyme required for sulfatase activity